MYLNTSRKKNQYFKTKYYIFWYAYNIHMKPRSTIYDKIMKEWYDFFWKLNWYIFPFTHLNSETENYFLLLLAKTNEDWNIFLTDIFWAVNEGRKIYTWLILWPVKARIGAHTYMNAYIIFLYWLLIYEWYRLLIEEWYWLVVRIILTANETDNDCLLMTTTTLS